MKNKIENNVQYYKETDKYDKETSIKKWNIAVCSSKYFGKARLYPSSFINGPLLIYRLSLYYRRLKPISKLTLTARNLRRPY